MFNRNVTSAVRGLAVAALLSAAPIAASAALAQEAITLETIGAVRMAQPDEIRRMTAEQERTRAPQSPQRREEQEASAR